MSRNLELVFMRQILLRMARHVSIRQASKQLNLNRKTVTKYYKIFATLGSAPEELLKLDNEALYTLIYGPNEGDVEPDSKRKQELLQLVPYIQRELQRVGVTLKLLWEDYHADKSIRNPYGYVSFCRILRPELKAAKSTLKKHYTPGEYLMVDFAGDKVCYLDKSTGELVSCVVYVGVLSFSNYAYVEVLPNAKLPFLIQALNNNLKYIQGVPLTVLSDNMAQLVTRAHRYEPTFTRAINEWASHNWTAIEACSVASPQQKSPVENHVKLAYQKIYAPLRDIVFYSISELQEAFLRKLNEFNSLNYQGRTYSRYDQFITEEIFTLNPLPTEPYELKYIKIAKVQKNYHVLLEEDKHFYSVPVKYVGEDVELNYNTRTVEIYHNHSRICTHARDTKQWGYTTVKEHMPIKDQIYTTLKGYQVSDFIERALNIGPNTRDYIDAVIKSRIYPQHAFKGCLGILRLGQECSYGPTRLERACIIGLALQKYSYATIEKILKNGIDKRDDRDDPSGPGEHTNLRGPEAF